VPRLVENKQSGIFFKRFEISEYIYIYIYIYIYVAVYETEKITQHVGIVYYDIMMCVANGTPCVCVCVLIFIQSYYCFY